MLQRSYSINKRGGIVDLNKIRNMNDEELENYLRSLSSKKSACVKCGKTNPNYTMNIQNKKRY